MDEKIKEEIYGKGGESGNEPSDNNDNQNGGPNNDNSEKIARLQQEVNTLKQEIKKPN
jgi:hypothetical protein